MILTVACSTCPHGERRCAGPCSCLLDGKDIQLHKQYGYCPHPDGAKFGTGKKPKGWEDMPVRPLLPVADLTGYDPATDPQSPKVGGCCDPPKE